MKRISKFITLSLFVSATFLFIPAQGAVKVADCFAVKKAEFERAIFGNKTYVVEFYSVCSMSSIAEVDKFSNTNLTFTATGKQRITSTVTIYNFNNNKIFTFELGNALSGEYKIKLDLAVRSDGSKRTILLPNLILEDPINCIKEVNTSVEVGSLEETTIYVVLKNNCFDIPSRDFYYSDIEISLQVSTQTVTEKRKIETLSGIRSVYVFAMPELKTGTYYPKLIIDGYPSGKSIQLMSFVISPKPTPEAAPATPEAKPSMSETGASTSEAAQINLQLCAYSKNIGESCDQAPKWLFEFCTVSESGQLQQKIGTKWTTLKTFKGNLKSKSCEKTNPNFFTVSGISKTTKEILQFRISLKATSKYKATLYYFSVKPKISS
jgi:hypothetical protein